MHHQVKWFLASAIKFLGSNDGPTCAGLDYHARCTKIMHKPTVALADKSRNAVSALRRNNPKTYNRTRSVFRTDASGFKSYTSWVLLNFTRVPQAQVSLRVAEAIGEILIAHRILGDTATLESMQRHKQYRWCCAESPAGQYECPCRRGSGGGVHFNRPIWRAISEDIKKKTY